MNIPFEISDVREIMAKCVMVEAENNYNPHLRPSQLKIVVVITITIIIINNKNSNSSNSDHPVFFSIAVPFEGKYENKNKTNIKTPKLPIKPNFCELSFSDNLWCEIKKGHHRNQEDDSRSNKTNLQLN